MTKNKKEKKLRIMINSNSPWSKSGYAQQAAQFLPLIRDEGYPIACVCFFGLNGGVIELDGIKMYPRMESTWGDDAMIAHAKTFNADVMFTLQDIWTLQPQTLQKLEKDGRRFIPIVPIDHEPSPSGIFDRLRFAYRVVTYAPFGTRELKRLGMHSTYIPHTIDKTYYKKYDKKECRKKLGIPDDLFLFGMVAANKDNPPRKCFQHVMDAFVKFHKKRPKSALYFHTNVGQKGGFPIKEYAKFLGIENQIYHVSWYEQTHSILQDEMPRIYSAMDCLLCPSLNEGFGVPIIEAQACEVPVITNDFTAMKDLVIEGKTGYLTKVLYKRFDAMQSYVGVPDPKSIYKCMEKVFKADREKMGKAGRKFVLKNFELQHVWDTKWKVFLNQLEKEIYK